MNFLIMDCTNNSGEEYIGECGENCSLEEQAMVFTTEDKAEQRIKDNGWESWASTQETDYPANQ